MTNKTLITDTSDDHNLSYGIEPIREHSNPNEYKIRARIQSKPQRDFYTDEVFYSFPVEINDQGNRFVIPVVMTETIAKESGINPESDILPGKSLECRLSLQGRF